MENNPWQPHTSIQAISFDCDGTLSKIEGIDHLAKLNGIYDSVAKLTNEAMEKAGLSHDLYEKRLNLVNPHKSDMDKLTKEYINQLTPGVLEVIDILQSLNKSIYVISAGNNPSVTDLGKHLTIPKEHCHAVDLHFDDDGHYSHFDNNSPMILNTGKTKILAEIKKRHGTVLHIGDGMNDVSCADATTRFIGYGGHFHHKTVAALSPFYITCESMLALLPLCLTRDEVKQLSSIHAKYYQIGLDLLPDHVLNQPK